MKFGFGQTSTPQSNTTGGGFGQGGGNGFQTPQTGQSGGFNLGQTGSAKGFGFGGGTPQGNTQTSGFGQTAQSGFQTPQGGQTMQSGFQTPQGGQKAQGGFQTPQQGQGKSQGNGVTTYHDFKYSQVPEGQLKNVMKQLEGHIQSECQSKLSVREKLASGSLEKHEELSNEISVLNDILGSISVRMEVFKNAFNTIRSENNEFGYHFENAKIIYSQFSNQSFDQDYRLATKFYTYILKGFHNRMVQYNTWIDDIAQFATTSSEVFTPSMIKEMLQYQLEYMVSLSSKVSEIHAKVETLKSQYTDYRKKYYRDNSDPFKEYNHNTGVLIPEFLSTNTTNGGFNQIPQQGGLNTGGGFGTPQNTGGFGTPQNTGGGFGTGTTGGGFGTGTTGGGFGTSTGGINFATKSPQSGGGFGTGNTGGGFGTGTGTTGGGFGTGKTGGGFGTGTTGGGFGTGKTGGGFGTGTGTTGGGFGTGTGTTGGGGFGTGGGFKFGK